jgi:DNA-binding Lrp family transcriptional regulator
VVKEAAKIKGVQSACAVTGAFDVIATFEVKDITEIADLIVKGIHSIEGVCYTQTAVCVKC